MKLVYIQVFKNRTFTSLAGEYKSGRIQGIRPERNYFQQKIAKEIMF